MPRAPSRAWPFVAGLLIAAFIARAPLYLCVFQPFEGWDEYRHLGYIVHLDETGTLPLYESRVPLAIRPLVVALPHWPWGRETMRQWGALSYAEHWTTPAQAADAPPPFLPRLYQSQRPPLAYVEALPVWRALGAARPLEAHNRRCSAATCGRRAWEYSSMPFSWPPPDSHVPLRTRA